MKRKRRSKKVIYILFTCEWNICLSVYNNNNSVMEMKMKGWFILDLFFFFKFLLLFLTLPFVCWRKRFWKILIMFIMRILFCLAEKKAKKKRNLLINVYTSFNFSNIKKIKNSKFQNQLLKDLAIVIRFEQQQEKKRIFLSDN